MILPFETSFSVWFEAIPHYEWVPLVPTNEPGVAGCAVAAGNASHMQAVFAGVEWVAYPVWHAQANPAWDLCIRNRQDEADEHSREQARHARREPPPVGNTPSWEAPQSPDAISDTKLDGEGD